MGLRLVPPRTMALGGRGFLPCPRHPVVCANGGPAVRVAARDNVQGCPELLPRKPQPRDCKRSLRRRACSLWRQHGLRRSSRLAIALPHGRLDAQGRDSAGNRAVLPPFQLALSCPVLVERADSKEAVVIRSKPRRRRRSVPADPLTQTIFPPFPPGWQRG